MSRTNTLIGGSILGIIRYVLFRFFGLHIQESRTILKYVVNIEYELFRIVKSSSGTLNSLKKIIEFEENQKHDLMACDYLMLPKGDIQNIEI